ncbi:phage portal protein [Luteolibacter soli]|uniref:Phage portal protein n=1 Tax=Luteolibacter soli TaxID=3135280 RepID=A0ABU9AZ25_9BACT
MFSRLKAAATVLFTGQNTPAVPVDGGDEGTDSDVGTTSLPPNWAKMWGGDGAGTSSADRLAAVYGCVQVIATSIAAMPLQLYRKNGDRREKETAHPLARLLEGRPNEVMTWTELREALLYEQILRGNAFVRAFWSGGNVRELFPVPRANVTAKLTDQRRIQYKIGTNPNKVPEGNFGFQEVLHFKALTGDGLEGINPIKHCRMSTAAAAALSRYGRTSAEEGQPLRGIITAETTFKNDTQAKQVRSRWGQAWNDAKNGDGIAIFEGGDMKFHQVTMSMRDAQFIESMEFSVEEICRIFNVPPHRIHKLDRATFSNIEHQSKEFYTGTLVPWITRIEDTLDHCLLTEGDRAAGLYFRHNADALLRGDLKTRSESYYRQITSGVMKPNEARALEERPPVEGGDQLFIPTNHVPIELAGKVAAGAPAKDQKTDETDPPTDS